MRVDFSRPAERDLRQIALFIGTDNPQRAITFVLELRAAAKALGDMPERFEKIADRGEEPVRRRPHKNYVIFYRHNKERVAVLRIVHGSAVTSDFFEDLR